MKVAILHSGDLEKVSPGGVSQYVKNFIKYSLEDEVTVFGTCTDQEETGVEYIKTYAGKEYVFIPITNNQKKPLSIFYFLMMFRYFKQFQKYDILYAQRMEYVIPFLFSGVLRKKSVFIVHGSIQYAQQYYGRIIGIFCKFMEGIAVHIAEKVIIILKREGVGLSYYQEKYRHHTDKFIYGKVPVNTKVFCKYDSQEVRRKNGIGERQKVIVYCGRVEEFPKRVMRFPEILAEVQKQYLDTIFIVIGEGKDLKALQEKAREMDLQDSFRFLGYLEMNQNTVELLNCADVAINISQFEGTCTSTLECIACGIPVVSTDVGDIGVCIHHGNNGRIIPNEDAKIIGMAAKEIVHLMDEKCYMDSVYQQYDGEVAFEELRETFKQIGK